MRMRVWRPRHCAEITSRKFAGQPRKAYVADWKEIVIKGDLVDLLGRK